MKSPAIAPIYRLAKYERSVSVTLWVAVVVAASAFSPARAGDNTPADHWNIMVVPSRQTAFSWDARRLFNKNCASCHGQDGRAQTPIARQRHVQDLSECKLEDAAIIQQILEGTHNKANTFKMPPFKEKLSRAEVVVLVPLVKAFRSAAQATSSTIADASQAGNPRLVGIVNLASFEYAIFEQVHTRGHYFMLRKNESHDGVTLLKIKPKLGMVEIALAHTKSDVKLSLEGRSGLPKRPGISGLIKNLGDAFTADPEGVVANAVNVDLVLFLYAQFTGKTLLRTPHLPDTLFDLDIHNSGLNDAAQGLKKALRAKGITTTEDGETFLLAVPETEAGAARQFLARFKSSARSLDRPALFPGGAIINLSNSELNEVVKLYAGLTGRKLEDTPTHSPLSDKVNFTTQTLLSGDDCIHACQVLFWLHGLEVVAEGSNAFKLEPHQP